MPRLFNELASLPATEPFSFGTRLGTVFIIEAACISLVAVVGCLCFIAFSQSRPRVKGRRWELSNPLHIYFLSMLISELFQIIGSLMNIRWVIEARVVQGPYCIAQGALKQIGEVTVAWAALAIAIHTCTALVYGVPKTRQHRFSIGVPLVIWITMAVIMGVSVATHMNDLKNYWGETQYWCWITTRYEDQQYTLDYVFMWITAFASMLLYIPLVLALKGWVKISGFTIHIRSKEERRNLPATSQGGSDSDYIAKRMILYPFVYILTVLPIAIVRFSSFHNHHVPFSATVIADVFFALSGLFNVILFSVTWFTILPSQKAFAASVSPSSPGLRASSGSHTAHSPRDSDRYEPTA